MRYIGLTFFLILTFDIVSSQSITSDLFKRQDDLFDTNFIKTNNIVRIIETDTSFIFNQLIATRSFHEYNTSGFKIFSGTVLEDGSLKTNLKYDYDSKGRLKRVTSPINSKGTLDSMIFNYIAENQLQVVSYGPLNLIINSTVFYDSIGYPIESYSYSLDSTLLDHETANYNYRKNRVRLKKLTEPTHRSVLVIDYKVEKEINYTNKKYNSYGDLISYKYRLKKYSIDYRYDLKDNWIYKKTYLSKKKNKKPIEIKYRDIDYKI